MYMCVNVQYNNLTHKKRKNILKDILKAKFYCELQFQSHSFQIRLSFCRDLSNSCHFFILFLSVNFSSKKASSYMAFYNYIKIYIIHRIINSQNKEGQRNPINVQRRLK